MESKRPRLWVSTPGLGTGEHKKTNDPQGFFDGIQKMRLVSSRVLRLLRLHRFEGFRGLR